MPSLHRCFVFAIGQAVPAAALASGGQLVSLEPTSISVVLPTKGSKEVGFSFAFAPSTNDFDYSVFVTEDPTCFGNPESVPGVVFTPQLDVMVQAGSAFFNDYVLDFDVNGLAPGQYFGTLCVTTFGAPPSQHNAVPISLLITDDALFVDGFDL
jgi:hypothetical protein